SRGSLSAGFPLGVRRVREGADSRIRGAEGSSRALASRGSTGAFTPCRRIVLARSGTVGRAPGLPGGRRVGPEGGLDLGGTATGSYVERSDSPVALPNHGRRAVPRARIWSSHARSDGGAREARG